MTKALKFFSAAALSAAMTLPAFADDIPLNSTVSGGAGQANVDGQTTLVGGELETESPLERRRRLSLRSPGPTMKP